MKWLLRLLVDEPDRRAIDADLAELYEVRRQFDGDRAAARWLRRQQFFYPVHLLAERTRTALLARMTTMPHLWKDVVYSLRSLARTPGLALTILLTVGVGLGATTAMVAVVRAVVLNPLPYADGDGIHWLYTDNPPFRFRFSVVDYRALEADHPLYLQNGSSVAATQNDVLGIVNAVDLIFTTDVQVHFVVSQLIIDAVPDPYTTSNAPALLTEFQNQWNGAYGAVQRDVAHLFSGRAIGAASGGTIGFAMVGVVCNLPYAYGLSQTHWSSNYAYRVGLTAHELGHNFNASHCDGQAACSVMCSTISGCSGNVSSFSANERAQIIAFRQTASCLLLQSTVPVIATATPAQFATVNPPLITLAGTGFYGTTAVTIGSQQVTTGITVVSDAQMRFTPPPGLPLGSQPVSVTNPAGTSNAVALTVTASNPCQVVVPTASFGGATLIWRMGGWPNDHGLLGVSLINSTSPVLDWASLSMVLRNARKISKRRSTAAPWRARSPP